MEKQVRVCVACGVDTLQGESVERREGRRRLGQAPGNLLRGLQRSLRGPADEAGRGKVGACCVRPASLLTVKVMVEGKISYRTFSFFISFFFFFLHFTTSVFHKNKWSICVSSRGPAE